MTIRILRKVKITSKTHRKTLDRMVTIWNKLADKERKRIEKDSSK